MDEAPNSRFSGDVCYLFTSSRNGKNYKITKKNQRGHFMLFLTEVEIAGLISYLSNRSS